MQRSLLIAIVATVNLLAFNCLQATAAVLSYTEGETPNTPDVHTVIYTDKIGSAPIIGGCIEIDGRSINVYGRPNEISERIVLLKGQLIKIKMVGDVKGGRLDAIACFDEGALIQKRIRTHQNEIVFIDGGFVSGKIDSFTPDTILINDHGAPRSVKLSTVLGIRSPRVYNLQLDLAAEHPAHQYNIISSALKETVPPQMISSQSVTHKWGDDDNDDDLDLGDDL